MIRLSTDDYLRCCSSHTVTITWGIIHIWEANFREYWRHVVRTDPGSRWTNWWLCDSFHQLIFSRFINRFISTVCQWLNLHMSGLFSSFLLLGLFRTENNHLILNFPMVPERIVCLRAAMSLSKLTHNNNKERIKKLWSLIITGPLCDYDTIVSYQIAFDLISSSQCFPAVGP